MAISPITPSSCRGMPLKGVSCPKTIKLAEGAFFHIAELCQECRRRPFRRRDVFLTPALLPPQFASTVEAFLKRWHVKLVEGPFCATNPHDFGRMIKTLLMSRDQFRPEERESLLKHYTDQEVTKILKDSETEIRDGFSRAGYVKAMNLLSEELGFKIQYSQTPQYVRDFLVSLPSNKSALFDSEGVRSALIGFRWGLTALKKIPFGVINHTMFWSAVGFTFNNESTFLQDVKGLALPHSKLSLYLEGGDAFIVTAQDKKSVALIGEGSLFLALLQLRKKGFPKCPELAQALEICQKAYTVDSPEIKEAAQEMYYFGLLQFKGPRQGTIESLRLLF